MIRVFFRAVWRLLILLAGVAAVWLTIFKVYPYADTRLPAAIVLLLIYAAFAYVIIPTLVRILRLFDKPDHIPLYAITPDGWPSDPRGGAAGGLRRSFRVVDGGRKED